LVFVTSMVDDSRSALSRLAVAEDHADEQVAASARRRKARLTAWITSRSQQGNGPGAPSSLVSIVSIRNWERRLSE
jgi:hypothetical protein